MGLENRATLVSWTVVPECAPFMIRVIWRARLWMLAVDYLPHNGIKMRGQESQSQGRRCRAQRKGRANGFPRHGTIVARCTMGDEGQAHHEKGAARDLRNK